MPAMHYYNNDSGMNVEKTVQQLISIERRPIKRMQREKGEKKFRIDAWKQVKKDVVNLESKIRNLSGFRAPFTNRILKVEDEGAITGTIKNGTPLSEKKIEVLNLATKHRLASDVFKNKDKIGPGSISIKVGNKEITFKITSVSKENFIETLKDKISEIANIETFHLGDGKQRIVLESKTIGKKGKFSFKDPSKIWAKLGILGTSENSSEKTELTFEKGLLLDFEPDKYYNPQAWYNVSSNGLQLDVQGKLAKKIVLADSLELDENSVLYLSWILPVNPIKKNDIKAMDIPEDSKDDLISAIDPDSIPGSINIGPRANINIGGIELKGYQLKREKDIIAKKKKDQKNKDDKKDKNDKNKKDNFEIKISFKDGSSLPLYSFKSGQKAEAFKKINLKSIKLKGKKLSDIKSIVFIADTIHKMSFIRPVIVKSFSDGGKGAKHEIAKAKDAVIKVDGMKLTRDRNTALKDIVSGASLNLKRKTNGPTLVKIHSNGEKASLAIKEFVEAYNRLMETNYKYSKASKVSSFGEDGKSKRKKQSGLLVGDSTLRRLISSIKNIITSSYPSTIKPAYRVISVIGISTGKIGSSWEEIQKGYLILNEDKLEQALSRSAESVKELFASDQNGDGRIDNGVAHRFAIILKPYTRFTRGMITMKIDLLKEGIADSNKRIARHEEYLKKFEAKTRDKFRRMESALKKSKSLQNYLKNNNPNNRR